MVLSNGFNSFRQNGVFEAMSLGYVLVNLYDDVMRITDADLCPPKIQRLIDKLKRERVCPGGITLLPNNEEAAIADSNNDRIIVIDNQKESLICLLVLL